MLGARVDVVRDPSVKPHSMRIELGGASSVSGAVHQLDGDSFAVSRRGPDSIVIDAGSERGLIHAAASVLEHLGAQFPVGAAPIFPRIEVARLAALESFAVTPSFKRRALVSDIMTWNYLFPDRLALHLEHDREFMPWMARRGINAFSFIRHAHDTQLRIAELTPLLTANGIDSEYGGHVLQTLLPRELFGAHPEFFPADNGGSRMATGNLCVSNPAAMKLVREAALKYVRDYPENTLLHVWGADVKRGAWCRCGACRELPPQLQYIKVVNAIADALGEDAAAPPVAYLAYHDTIEPHPALKPLDNVWFEWAPRERCYAHAIDDGSCEINPRYLDTLKRYIDLFDGRGHVFEYYADSILFSGLGFAMPQVIAADLKCYRSLGIESISCLTFGAYSALAYPVNLEAFARGARDVDFDPDTILKDTARGRHPLCSAEMTEAYRTISTASKWVLDYADVAPVMKIEATRRDRKRADLARAAAIFARAVEAAESIATAERNPLTNSERDLWHFSSAILGGLSSYLDALQSRDVPRGEDAIKRLDAAIEHIRRIDLKIKGTWGAYDLEWMRGLWLGGLRRALGAAQQPEEELF